MNENIDLGIIPNQRIFNSYSLRHLPLYDIIKKMPKTPHLDLIELESVQLISFKNYSKNLTSNCSASLGTKTLLECFCYSWNISF